MPKYNYKCKECEEVFEVIHGMSERLTDCEQCNTIDTLVKVPNKISSLYKEQEVGKIVDNYIEETRHEIREEKRRLQEQDWKSD